MSPGEPRVQRCPVAQLDMAAGQRTASQHGGKLVSMNSLLVYWTLSYISRHVLLQGPVLHPESLGSASVPSAAQCGRTQAAHLRFERQRGQRTSGAAALLLSNSFESDGDMARSGHRPDCSVQRSDTYNYFCSLSRHFKSLKFCL